MCTATFAVDVLSQRLRLGRLPHEVYYHRHVPGPICISLLVKLILFSRRGRDRKVLLATPFHTQYLSVYASPPLTTVQALNYELGRTVKDHSQHTIGVEFSSRTVKLGEKRIKLQVCLPSDRVAASLSHLCLVMGHCRPRAVPVCTVLRQ